MIRGYIFLTVFLLTILSGFFTPKPLNDLTINLNLNELGKDYEEGMRGNINAETDVTGIIGNDKTGNERIGVFDPLSRDRGRQTDKKIKRILGSSKYDPNIHNLGIPDWEHWTATLKIKKWKGDKPAGHRFCGAVLITKQHILTALHCIIMKEPPLLYGIILNYNDVEIFFDHKKLQRWKGMKFTPIGFYYTTMNSPNRKAERLSPVDNIPRDDIPRDDIALIKLNKKVTDPLQPIPRSKKDAIETLTSGATNNFWFAGWGIWKLPRQNSNFLRYTDKLTRKTWENDSLCPSNEPGGIVFQDTNICFLSTKDHAACKGDSGSPGVVRINDTGSTEPVWHLQSISSRGSKCSELTNGSLSIHMDVHKYEREINQWLTL